MKRIIIIIFLVVFGFLLYQNNVDVCPFSKLSGNLTQNDVINIFGYPDERTKWAVPDVDGTIHTAYSEKYTYTFMNNAGNLRIFYIEDKVYRASFGIGYPLYNPSIFDKSVHFSEETAKRLALHIIKYYTKKHGNYSFKRDSYMWKLDGGETIYLKLDPSEKHMPIQLEWHSS